MKKKLKLFSIIASSLLTLAYTNSNAEKADASLVINTPVDPSLFIEGALIGDVKTVDCTLSGGTKTRCYQMTIAGAPADPETSPEGPYCPPTIKSTAEEGGTWIDGKGIIYDVDGPFIENLATLYNDDEWQMYDKETGKITVINGARGCEVAGNPRPIPGFNNFCLECRTEHFDGGVKKTVLIPTTPVPAKEISNVQGRSNTGVALNGVLLGPPAPLEMILSSHTLGVFDDCGGHANPHEGYHYHAANGCSEIGIQKDGHTAMIGYALDGYALYAKEDKSTVESIGLDECNGHSDERGYHYHASAPGMNQIFTCFKGEKGSFEGDNNQDTQKKGGKGERSSKKSKTGKLPPGFNEAAETLGISGETLFKAMEEAGGRHADLSVAAKLLNITEDKLKAALPSKP